MQQQTYINVWSRDTPVQFQQERWSKTLHKICQMKVEYCLDNDKPLGRFNRITCTLIAYWYSALIVLLFSSREANLFRSWHEIDLLQSHLRLYYHQHRSTSIHKFSQFILWSRERHCRCQFLLSLCRTCSGFVSSVLSSFPINQSIKDTNSSSQTCCIPSARI